VHRKFALTVVAQSIDLKVGDLKVEGQRTSRTSAGRATLKGRTPIPSPRIARAGRGERAATFDTDRTLNIPLRQKEALSRPTKRRLSEPGSYIHSAILNMSQPSVAKLMPKKHMTEAAAFPLLMKHPGEQRRALARFASDHEREFAPIPRYHCLPLQQAGKLQRSLMAKRSRPNE
jgi:hypothetical protein